METVSTTSTRAAAIRQVENTQIRSQICAVVPGKLLSSSRRRINLKTSVVEGKRARTPGTRCTLNTAPSPSNSEDGDGPFGFGTTRLGRIIANRQKQFSNKFNSVRKKFPVKIFLLLLGYYAANALATILGQTGDWDVLAAGILVALIEGVGYLMYRAPSVLGERGKELIVYVNFWKSGFSFGLFVDAFKLGS